MSLAADLLQPHIKMIEDYVRKECKELGFRVRRTPNSSKPIRINTGINYHKFWGWKQAYNWIVDYKKNFV